MSKKYYVGVDLGDGEFITDAAALDETKINGRVDTNFMDMTMPDSNDPGKAIPTVYGYDENNRVVFASSIVEDAENVHDVHVSFKRRPTDLIPAVSEERAFQIIEMLKGGWPDRGACPELYSEGMSEFADAVVTFLNAVFGNESYKNTVRGDSSGCDEIVFCVGHPTKWNELDIAVYKQIIAGSLLGEGAYAGLKTRLVVAAESRAAFLYVRDKAGSGILPVGTCALLIDIGSSTIDLTAITADSRNHVYNSGSNYLGARSIDYLIRAWYLEKIKEDPDDWEVYQELAELNPTVDQSLALCCRLAKEKVFSTTAGTTKINFADFRPIRITKDDIIGMIETMPVADVLKKYSALPSDVYAGMGRKSWKTLFVEFVKEKKAEMEAQGVKLGKIILTGSASKMPFIREVVSSVFNELDEDLLLNDMNPSRSISMGLAMVGPSDEKYRMFTEAVEGMLDKDLPEIIRKDIPDLAKPLSEAIDKIVIKIMKKHMQKWRTGGYKTIADMTKSIEAECSGNSFQKLLTSDKGYASAIEKWMVDKVSEDLAVPLHGICTKYGVGDVKLGSLNVMKGNSIEVDGIKVNPAADISELIVNTLSIVTGIVAVVILPYVLGAICGILIAFTETLGLVLFALLMSIPGWGQALLLGMFTGAVIDATLKGLDGVKSQINEKLQMANLPLKARKLITDEKLDKEIKKTNTADKIYQSIVKEESAEKIVSSVSTSFRKLILAKAEDIKYAVDAR